MSRVKFTRSRYSRLPATSPINNGIPNGSPVEQSLPGLADAKDQSGARERGDSASHPH